MIRAAYAMKIEGLGHPILVGREELIHENMRSVGLIPEDAQLEIANARVSKHNAAIRRLPATSGCSVAAYLMRDVQRLVNQDRNSFAASMVALGYADGMVTGVTRSYDQALEEVMRVIDPAPGGRVIGMSIVLAKGHTLFVADTNVTELPEAEELVEIAIQNPPARCAIWASSRASPSCPTRPSATRWARARSRCARRWPSWTPAATSISNTRARCRRNWPSIRRSGKTTRSPA